MNEGLFSTLSQTESFQRLLDHVKKKEAVCLYNVPEGMRPFLTAALYEKTGRPVFAIVSTELNASRFAEDVMQYLGGKAGTLPARDIQFNRAAASNENNWRRLETLYRLTRRDVGVIALTHESLMDKMPEKELFYQFEITLEEGGHIAPKLLMTQLLHAGYERVEMVEGKGQCAMRGAILDFYPPQEPNAIRIEFFDEEIDSIRSVDAASQRSITRMKRIVIPPATEFLIREGDCAAAAAQMRTALDVKEEEEEKDAFDFAALPPLPEDDEDELSLPSMLAASAIKKPTVVKQQSDKDFALSRWLQDADMLESGIPFRRGQAWLHVLCKKLCTVLDWAENPIVLVDTPNDFADRVESRQKGFAEEFKTSLERGEAVAAQADAYFDAGFLQQAISQLSVVTVSDFLTGQGGFAPVEALDLDAKGIAEYHSQMKALVRDLAAWREEGNCIAVLTGGVARGKRLSKTLEEMDVGNVFADELNGNLVRGEVILLPMTLHKGFVWPQAGLTLVSDTDIYGAGYKKAHIRRNVGEKISAFTDLKVGDYVVHESHGVGLFKGIVQLQSDGTSRDYLLICYQGDDKLYVPTEQLDRVQRFIGSQGEAPKLNRLGGTDWQKSKNKVKASIKSMAFDLVKLYARRKATKGYPFSKETPWQRQFEDNFPYELTPDQQQSIMDIYRDMESNINMDRLLCGDVGYGKTEVALRAAFKAVMDGKQVAILAPTTILAQQHYNTVLKRFEGFPVNVEVLSRFKTPKEQKKIVEDLQFGKIDLIVGTHRLLAKDVHFRDLGLLIVDEEQRFGVAHKEVIKNIKANVDVLTLSATPIPRTLHMSMVGIRDMSLLETPPEERFPVKTFVMEYQDGIIRDAILRELNRGGQVYVLYNRVQSIERFYAHLKALVPEARVGIGHGQMKENALEDAMMDFYDGAYDVLLCTTIVENGLDVPTANTMIVYDSDRLGLSQLYQLRGRVGRSNRQAYAYFTVRSQHILSETAQKRLAAIREFTQFGAGFSIAMRDLEIRGAGNILGPEQHGHLSAVGYDMYCKMIEETIREVQGLTSAPDDLDTRMELKVNAYLPEPYVPDERQRMDLYRRISMLQKRSDLEDMQDELLDRFGEIPDPVINLLHIALLRGLSRSIGIVSVGYKGGLMQFRFDEKYAPDPMLLVQALEKCTDITLSATRPMSLNMRNPHTLLDPFLHQAVRRMEKLLDTMAAIAPKEEAKSENEE